MLTVGTSSNLYVTDTLFNRVQEFDTNTGNLITSWGSHGSSPSQFDYPVGVALDNQANVYVGDLNNDRVQKFLSTGTYVSSLTYPKLGSLSSPIDAALDGSGNIYIVDQGNDRVQLFSITGVFLLSWGTMGNATGHFDGPSGITIDHSGNLYVVDSNNNRIQKFYPNGTFIRTWGSFGVSNG